MKLNAGNTLGLMAIFAFLLDLTAQANSNLDDWARATDAIGASNSLANLVQAARAGDDTASFAIVVLHVSGQSIPWTSMEAATYPGRARTFATQSIRAGKPSSITSVLAITRDGLRCSTTSTITEVSWTSIQQSGRQEWKDLTAPWEAIVYKARLRETEMTRARVEAEQTAARLRAAEHAQFIQREKEAAQYAEAEQRRQTAELAEKYARAKADWDYLMEHEVAPSARAAISNNTVLVGMSKLEVIMAWGLPTTIHKTIWEATSAHEFVYPDARVILVNDQVVKAEQSISLATESR